MQNVALDNRVPVICKVCTSIMQNVVLDNGVPIICKVCTSIMQNVALDNKAPVIWKVCLCLSNLQCIMWYWIIKVLLLVKCATTAFGGLHHWITFTPGMASVDTQCLR